jgi:hypothetical protein
LALPIRGLQARSKNRRALARGLTTFPSLAIALGLAAASGLPAGCSYPTHTTPYPGVCTPMDVVGSSPGADSAGAPTDTVVTLDFSDYPDPDTVATTSMLLTTGVFRVPETYRVDLVRKAVTMTPVGRLVALLGYSASVFPDLRSLAGCSASFQVRSFMTAQGAANNPPAPVPSFSDLQPILDGACAGNCHADTSGGCLAAPVSGLSLCASEARDALVNVASREVTGQLLVSPGDSARSYLLRKLLATADGGPIATTRGEREPPGDPLTQDQLATIAAWIDGGALP